MKSLLKKMNSFALLAALIALVSVATQTQQATAAPADDSGAKNIAVISFSGYDALFEDINFVGSMTGQPEMGKNLEGALAFFTQGQGLAGLTKDKPWGAVVRSGQGMPEVLGFVPVKDLKQLLDIAAAFEIYSDKGDNGVITIQGKQPGQQVCIKEEGGWAFIAQTPDQLKNLPVDPEKLLVGLSDKYDVAARLYVQNIPDEMMNMALEAMKAGAQEDLYQRDGETDSQYEIRKKTVESVLKQSEQFLADLDHLLIGLSVDSKEKKAFLDLQLGAVPGSNLAAQMEASKSLNSKFGGFVAGDPAISGNILSKLDPSSIQQLESFFGGMRSQIMEEIANDPKLPDDQARELAKSVVNDLIDVALETAQEGMIDGAGRIELGESNITLTAGAQVSDGRKVEEALNKLAKVVESEPDFPGTLKRNAAEANGVDFHVVTIPVPDENARKVFGDSVDVVFGFSDKGVYLAAGSDAVEKLKSSITGSDDSSGADLPNLGMTAAVGKLATFAAAHDPKPETQLFASLLSDADGNDHVSLTSTVTSDTNKLRFEIEESLLRAIVAAAKMAQQKQQQQGGQF